MSDPINACSRSAGGTSQPAHPPVRPRATSYRKTHQTPPRTGGRTDITLDHVPHIRDAVAELERSLQPHAERESRILFRIDTRGPQHIRLTIPQPPHSTHPGPPFLFGNQMSTSADGSVNGKKCGRIRVRASGPNSDRANASRVPRRWAIVSPRSTAEPLDFDGTPGCGSNPVRQYEMFVRSTRYRPGDRVPAVCAPAPAKCGSAAAAVSPRVRREGVLLASRGVIGREVQSIEVELLRLDFGPSANSSPSR